MDREIKFRAARKISATLMRRERARNRPSLAAWAERGHCPYRKPIRTVILDSDVEFR